MVSKLELPELFVSLELSQSIEPVPVVPVPVVPVVPVVPESSGMELVSQPSGPGSSDSSVDSALGVPVVGALLVVEPVPGRVLPVAVEVWVPPVGDPPSSGSPGKVELPWSLPFLSSSPAFPAPGKEGSGKPALSSGSGGLSPQASVALYNTLKRAQKAPIIPAFGNPGKDRPLMTWILSAAAPRIDHFVDQGVARLARRAG